MKELRLWTMKWTDQWSVSKFFFGKESVGWKCLLKSWRNRNLSRMFLTSFFVKIKLISAIKKSTKNLSNLTSFLWKIKLISAIKKYQEFVQIWTLTSDTNPSNCSLSLSLSPIGKILHLKFNYLLSFISFYLVSLLMSFALLSPHFHFFFYFTIFKWCPIFYFSLCCDMWWRIFGYYTTQLLLVVLWAN